MSVVDVWKSNRAETGGWRLVVSVPVCGADMKDPRPVVSVDATLWAGAVYKQWR